MKPHPRTITIIALACLALATFPASSLGAARTETKSAFVPIGSSTFADVNAKEGDTGFLAEYFATPDLSGAPVITRLESTAGSGGTSIRDKAKGFSARWAATVTPKRSGTFSLSLRSVGAATVLVDGKAVLQRPTGSASFTERTIGKIDLRDSRPYEFVVELRSPDAKGRIAVEWSAPEPAAATTSTVAAPAEILAGPAPGAALGPTAKLENEAYTLESQPDGAFVLTEKATGAHARFAPEFLLVWQPQGREVKEDPNGGKYLDDALGWMNYRVPSWDKETDFLVAAHPRLRLRPSAVAAEPGKITWSFPAQTGFALKAEVTLPPGNAEPVIAADLRATAAAQFSLAYAGTPATATTNADWIWQPLIWQEQRFPNRSYLTKEFQCPIPWAMAAAQGVTVGVGADAREMPYRMPTVTDSRFGVLVRNAVGDMQPLLFAPVLGHPDSKIKAGGAYHFVFRVCARKGGWYDTYKHLAQSLYDFGDVRENAECSLNTTIENMLAFILTDRFSYWYPRFKTWGYQNDGGPGAGRQQSAADAIGLALVCDSAAFYKLRALPTLEYMLSRKSVSTSMNRADFMGGPVKSPVDLTAAYRLTGRRCTSLRELLAQPLDASAAANRRLAGTSSITLARTRLLDALTQYRLTGDKALLAQACAAADRYIALRLDQPVRDFRDAGSSFWNELSPAWDLLYELYDETGERKYLDAAATAMRPFTGFTYLVPVIPNGNFTANPGGVYNGQPVPEEIVPAWQVSANGLAAECAGTARSHRGVFMAPYASYLARLGRDAADPFFTDIARNAIVGRYANYPSYAYRNGYTTVHQKADYPLRSFEEIKKFTTAHYNHPLPMAAFLVDYLISDIYARSAGQVDFPSEYTTTGAYFRNKLYGARPGRFYTDTNVVPWLPKALLRADTIQLNYLAARGNGQLYLALANQSPQPVTATLTLNPARVSLPGARRARQWLDNRPADTLPVADGRLTVSVSPKGLTCVAIPDASAVTELQDAMIDPASPPLPAGSAKSIDTSFGKVTATALRFGKGLTTVHVWLAAGPEKVKRAELKYSIAPETRHTLCREFPYEFTIPVPDTARTFSCSVEVETPGGASRSALIELNL